MSGNEPLYIDETFRNNWIAPLGPNVDAFEISLAKYTGAQYACTLSSGTAAIHLGLIMNNVGPGDYVLCQSFTFAATAFPILYQGATPVFIDSEEKSWNLDPKLLDQAIKNCINGTFPSHINKSQIRLLPKKPKVIIPVHLYGMPYDVEGIHTVAKKYGIPIIEDAAEALGSKYNNMSAGSFGNIAVLYHLKAKPLPLMLL